MVGNIVLIGPMGAGKSTIGRMLASRLEYDFVDTDHLIEKRSGADIAWIFDVEGEEGFRQREAKVLEEVLGYTQTIVATGGGIVLRDENRDRLKNANKVIYLTATIEQLVQRTSRDKKRPLLQVEDPKQKIIDLFNERDPLYRSVASNILVTDNSSPKLVVQKIVDLIEHA